MLITIPWWDLGIPHCAPAVLKGIAGSYGYNIKTYDFSLDLLHKFCNSDVNLYEKQQSYFVIGKQSNQIIDNFYQHVIDTVNQINCRYIGISVFSVWTHRATLDILSLLKKHSNKKILLGGRGLSSRAHIAVHPDLTSAEKLINFDQILKKRKLADYFILGDGEDAIIDFLNENNIDSDLIHGSNKNLDYPFSNFDDVRFSEYIGIHGKLQLPVISSKGCVRSCDFCDVAAHMKHFQSKQGVHLADEIIYLAKKYKIYNFVMSDSIANGNMKSLRECCEKLAEYNATNNNKIKWAANWICRYENTTKPTFFDLLAASGCESLAIGVESGSNHVLMSMNKKSSVEGVHYELAQFDRVGIQVTVNNVIGHWSEHYENFLEHVDFLIKIGPYLANRTIKDLQLSGFAVLKDTPAAALKELMLDTDNYTHMWYACNNPDLTIRIKLLRTALINSLCLMLNYPVLSMQTKLELLYETILEKKDYWNNWIKQQIDFDNFNQCPTLMFLENFENYIDKKIKQTFSTSDVKIIVRSHAYNGSPKLTICHNGNTVHSEWLNNKETEINFNIAHDFSKVNSLTMTMTGKDKFDTKIDSEGNIVEDKCIVFEKIQIDGIDIIRDVDFFYKQTNLLLENNNLVAPTAGLYLNNSQWQFTYIPPVWRYYLSKQNYVDYRLNNDIKQSSIVLDKIVTEIVKMEY